MKLEKTDELKALIRRMKRHSFAEGDFIVRRSEGKLVLESLEQRLNRLEHEKQRYREGRANENN